MSVGQNWCGDEAVFKEQFLFVTRQLVPANYAWEEVGHTVTPTPKIATPTTSRLFLSFNA